MASAAACSTWTACSPRPPRFTTPRGSEMFDDFLRERSRRTGEPFVPFDPVKDYDEYVDGKPRDDGTRSFLASRGIELPEGGRTTRPARRPFTGSATARTRSCWRRSASDGVEAYPGSVRYVRAARDAGLRRAVVSSSANCRDVLAAAGIEDLFEVRIDGIVAEREHLRGKPAPDTFLAGARALGLEAGEAAVFEDALAGVEAGRAGQFGYRRRRRSRRAGGGAATARRGRRRDGSGRVAGPLMIKQADVHRRALVRCGRPRSTSTGWPRPSRCSRCPTATSAGAATWTRASRTACRAATSTASTSCGRCPTPRRRTGCPSPARRSSTSPTAS